MALLFLFSPSEVRIAGGVPGLGFEMVSPGVWGHPSPVGDTVPAIPPAHSTNTPVAAGLHILPHLPRDSGESLCQTEAGVPAGQTLLLCP